MIKEITTTPVNRTSPSIRSPFSSRRNNSNNNSSPLTQIPHLYRREYPQPSPPPPYGNGIRSSSSTLPIASPSTLKSSSPDIVFSFNVTIPDKYAPSASSLPTLPIPSFHGTNISTNFTDAYTPSSTTPPPSYSSYVNQMDDEFGDGNYMMKGELYDTVQMDWFPKSIPMGQQVYTVPHTAALQQQRKTQSKWIKWCIPCVYNRDTVADPSPHVFLNFLFTFATLISVIQIVMMVVMIMQKGFAPFSENKNYGPPEEVIVRFGAKVSYYMKYEKQVWRFVTPIFLHAGVIHIILNLLAQLRFGPAVEKSWGRLRFLIVYFVTGIAAVLTSCLIQPNTVSVGASGSICGLVGAYTAEVVMVWATLSKHDKRLQVGQLIIFIVTLGLLSLFPQIDSSAHLGGYLTGILVGLIIFPKANIQPTAFKLRNIFAIILLGYLTFGFIYFYIVTSPSPIYLP